MPDTGFAVDYLYVLYRWHHSFNKQINRAAPLALLSALCSELWACDTVLYTLHLLKTDGENDLLSVARTVTILNVCRPPGIKVLLGKCFSCWQLTDATFVCIAQCWFEKLGVNKTTFQSNISSEWWHERRTTVLWKDSSTPPSCFYLSPRWLEVHGPNQHPWQEKLVLIT